MSSIFSAYLDLAHSVEELGKDLGFTYSEATGEPEEDPNDPTDDAKDAEFQEELDRENPEIEDGQNHFPSED